MIRKEVVKAKVEIFINPDSLTSRNAACQAFHEFLTDAGTVHKKRKPKSQLASFFDAMVTWSRKFTKPTTRKEAKTRSQQFRRWYKEWLKEVHVQQKKAKEA